MRTCDSVLKFVMLPMAAVFACFVFIAEAVSFDTHEWFESRCGGCHRHAGDLAREKLIVVDGVLHSRLRGGDIRAFLPRHFGKPNPTEVAALYDLLLWQNQAGGEFKTRCAICHVKARTLAQTNLIHDGNVLRGRFSNRDMTEFLGHHGRIEAAEVDFFVRLLMRHVPPATAGN